MLDWEYWAELGALGWDPPVVSGDFGEALELGAPSGPSVTSPGLCEGFNIDVGQPRVFQGSPESQFGYRVLQWGGDGNKWLLVGAPWDGNGQGDIYKCSVGLQNSSCAKASLGAVAPWLRSSTGHLGMTLVDSKDGGFVACAPLWSQECGTSVFSSGRCVQLNEELQLVGTIAPTAQRCSTYMDIILVLDGSNSIYPWEEVQAFLGNILGRFFIGPGQTQVGVLQYGERLGQEWALGQHPTAQRLLEAARNLTRQEGRETRTAMAIRQACTESFSPAQGGRPGAPRLLLLGDGESHDGDELPAALAECDRHNVTRYAIAVLGHYLRRQQDPEDFIREIKSIASDPDEKYFFNVTDEAALSDIVDALGDRIFSLEGTHGDNESAFELEMSQIGFSIHRLEDGILFGMVGAYDWEGGVLEESQRGRIVPPREAFQEEFPLELKNHAAYLGYSVSSLQLPGGQRLFVAGAPRFQHKGKVVLFQLDPTGTVTVAQALMGEQIGSYFGSEVLALDLEGDGDSDLLLVAAPTYLGGQSRETGRVYVYRVGQDRLIPAGALHPSGPAGSCRCPRGCLWSRRLSVSHDGTASAAAPTPVRPRAAETRTQNPVDMDIDLRYNVSLEERIPGSRAAFDSGARRLLQRRIEFPLGRQSCVRVPFHVLDTSDYLRPLSLTLTWALDAAARSVLDEASPTTIRKLIPFFKDCGDDDECVTDLVLKATTDIVGSRQSPHILRKGRRRMLVEVELENQKENAYNASLCLHLPGNLHFSSLVLQDPSTVKLECSALGGQRQHCSVGYPVFRSQAKVSFTLELEFSCSVLLDHAEVMLQATSDSTEATPEDNVVTLSVPILYEPDLFLSSNTDLHRYEVHPLGTFTHSSGPEFTTTVKVQNFGCYPIQNVTLHMALPALGHRQATILSVTRVLADNATCVLQPPPEGTQVVPVPPEALLQLDRLDCSNTWCQELSCRLGRLERGGGVSVQLLRTLHDSFFSGVKFQSVRIVSSVWLGVAGGVLVLEKGAQRRELVLEVLQGRRVPVSLWILGGSALGGLLLLALLSLGLWRLGFFSHRKPSREEEDEEH
ncbi:PREDICTED: integrin alpha-10 [Corvus brachyrhynchos]|uniref:integrin alpha-10 n=1 Tax=Corvus brachyrhynchos TaxID=85066 RepID=UPI000816463B|nr:PREDICTED: integrin alpha-10 [Corvus brachyrhynchos]